MQILTLENTAYLLNKIPDQVEEDMRFAVLDNSDPASPDFFFVPLIYLESFASPSAVLEIENQKIQMPLDWHILLGDPECGDLEILPLTSLNDMLPPTPGMEFKAKDVNAVCIALALPVIFFTTFLA